MQKYGTPGIVTVTAQVSARAKNKTAAADALKGGGAAIKPAPKKAPRVQPGAVKTTHPNKRADAGDTPGWRRAREWLDPKMRG
jgi:hypothetical protein